MIFDVFSDVAEQGERFFIDCANAAGHEIGLFDFLVDDGWISTDAAAKCLGVRKHRLGPLLGVLALQGSVAGQRDHGRMRWALREVPPCPEVPREGLGLLAEVLKEQIGPLAPDDSGVADGGNSYLGYLADKARQAGDVLLGLDAVKAAAAGGALLDAGGGHGEHSAAWLRLDERNTATLVDRAENLPVEALAEFGARATQVAGEVEAVALPGKYDVALLSNVLHLHSEARAMLITDAVVKAVKPGGLVVIKEVLLDELHEGPAAGAFFSLSLVTYTDGGRCYAVGELTRLLQLSLGDDVGGIEVHREPGGLADQVVLIARKKA